MNCDDCDEALRDPEWPGISADCADCDIRVFAMSPGEIREMWIDQVEGACGHAAAQEVRRRVNEEVSRIKALKGART